MMFSALNRLDRWRNKEKAESETDVGRLLPDLPVIKGLPNDNWPEVDFFIDLRGGPTVNTGYGLSGYGVWYFQFGSSRNQGGDSFRSWEAWLKETVLRVRLCSMNGNYGPHAVLREGYFSIDPISPGKTFAAAARGAADWPALACADIINGRGPSGGGADFAKSRHRPSPDMSSTFVAVQCLFLFLWRRLVYFLGTFRDPFWGVGIIRAPIHEFLDNPRPAEIEWIANSSRRYFYADPFAVTDGTTTTILAERYDYKTARGDIVSFVNPDSGETNWKKNAIEAPCHMSYPFVFEDQGQTYCVPETHQIRRVILFNLDPARNEWRKDAVLIKDFAAVDTTLVRHDDRWWMFCTDNDDYDTTKLLIWFADTLHGPWTPHPRNPVKCDVRSARPGGTPFVHNGVLYRPSQDCSKRYGWALTINRVDVLNDTEFVEKPHIHLSPDIDGRYPEGLHTLSAAGPVTLVDGYRLAWTFGQYFRKFHRFFIN